MSQVEGARGPLVDRVQRLGRGAWALLGIVLLGAVLLWGLGQLRVVVVPLLVALFPAALLDPLARRLRGRLPRSVVALGLVGLTLAGLLAILAGSGWLLAQELDELGTALEDAYEDLRRTLRDSPLDVDPGPAEDLLATVREWAFGSGGGVDGAARTATLAVETATAILFGIVALFFYLKDGDRIAAWLRDRFPARHRPDVDAMGTRAWDAIGGYFRGQVVVAGVDAIGIGIGLVLLGVPAAGPLATLVFFGGFFPIVGAFVTGLLAVLVALAHGGPGLALVVLGLVIGVQQLEGNVLEPVIVGRAVRLHPFAVLVALTTGAVAFGILGAFVAVPLAAGVARCVEYLHERDAGEPDP